MTLPSSAMTSRKNRESRATGPPRRAVALDDLGGRASEASVLVELLTRVSSVEVRACQRRGWRRRAQGRQDLNLQQPVLETGTLPIELRPSTRREDLHRCAGAPGQGLPTPGLASVRGRPAGRVPTAAGAAGGGAAGRGPLTAHGPLAGNAEAPARTPWENCGP